MLIIFERSSTMIVLHNLKATKYLLVRTIVTTLAIATIKKRPRRKSNATSSRL